MFEQAQELIKTAYETYHGTVRRVPSAAKKALVKWCFEMLNLRIVSIVLQRPNSAFQVLEVQQGNM